MTASRDSLLFACILGTSDDPTPGLQARMRGMDDSSQEAHALQAAINELTDAEIHVRLAASGAFPNSAVVGTDVAALRSRHQKAVDAARALLESPSYA